MASVWLTGFLPEEWSDFIGLLDALVDRGAGLFRWEEHYFEDGTRRRTAHVVRDLDGPSVEEIGRVAIERARGLGFRSAGYEHDRALLRDDRDRLLRVGFEPLPRQVVLDVTEPAVFASRAVPAIEGILLLTSQAGARSVRSLHRHAELDLESQNRFFPPTTRAVLGGPYDAAALCDALAAVDFAEEGDAWVRETERVVAEVRLRDDRVEVQLTPRHGPALR